MLRSQEKRLHTGQRIGREVLPRRMPAFGSVATLLTAFAGTESPLIEGGLWSRNTAASGVMRKTSGQVNSSAVTTVDSTTTRAYKDVEAYFTVATKPAVNVDNVFILARVVIFGNIQDAAAYNAYSFNMQTEAGTDSWELRRWDAGVSSVLVSGTREWTDGELLGIRCWKDTIEGWVFTGGAWTRLASIRDATYSAAGGIGIRGRGTTFRVDDLFVGEIP